MNIKLNNKFSSLKTSITELKVKCGNLIISLNDDSKPIDNPLLYFTIYQATVDMDMYEKQDSAAIFILKKMGIYK